MSGINESLPTAGAAIAGSTGLAALTPDAAAAQQNTLSLPAYA